MIRDKNVIVMDIDGTLCHEKKKDQSYLEIKPKIDILDKLHEYRNNGFYVILYTSRQMRTHDGNLGRINAETAKVLFQWLELNKIPYDEIYFGKPWCGFNGFYVDDKAIRPSEFSEKSYEEIMSLLQVEK